MTKKRLGEKGNRKVIDTVSLLAKQKKEIYEEGYKDGRYDEKYGIEKRAKKVVKKLDQAIKELDSGIKFVGNSYLEREQIK